jgi:phage tail-like protein
LNTFSNIALKWGISDDTELWEWRQQASEGKVERKNGSIVLLDDVGEEKGRWNFREGWPSKWTGNTFNATATEVAVETLEIAHEGVARA